MTDPNMKHPNFANDLLPEDQDVFKPEFKRDTRGRYFMQLPGYGKWMVGNEPGSKIISQGSEDEKGGAGTSPGSLQTGSISAETTITVGDQIFLNGSTGCIYIGDFATRAAASIDICPNGIQGYSSQQRVFALLLQNTETEWRAGETLDKGDVFMGSIAANEFVLWNESEDKLYIKGDLVIEGDIVSATYPTPPYYWLDYSEGDIEISGELRASNVDISGGGIDSPVTLPDSQTMGDVTAHVIATGNTHQADVDELYDAQLYMSRIDDTILWDIIDGRAYYIRDLWTQRIAATSPETSGVIIDAGGIRGYDASSNLRFKLNAATGDYYFGEYPGGNYTSFDTSSGILELHGTIYALAGEIGGWDIGTDRLWKQIPDSGSGPPYTKLELNVREAAGINMHIQAFTDDNSSYSSATGIQITPGLSTAPDPRLDIYEDGTRRVTLNTTGLRFYASDGTTVTQRILMGTTDGDVTFGGGIVRLFANGIRVSYPQGLNIADGLGEYQQHYCGSDIFTGSVIAKTSLPTNNYWKIESNINGAIAYFSGVYGGPWALNLFGNLALYGNTYDQGNTEGAMYLNTSTNTVRVNVDGTVGGWQDLGGSGLPAGNADDMMRHNGTTWEATADVFVGSRPDYKMYRDPSTTDWILYLPNTSVNWGFKMGSSFVAVIDENFWTTGHIYADGAIHFGNSIANLSYSLGTIYSNKEIHASGSLRCTGFLECSTAAIKVGGKIYTPIYDFALGKWVLGAT